jgi:uncharacterized protein YjbJ (UPF0337 family)
MSANVTPPHTTEEEMAAKNVDKAKGRAKEAAGALTGDKKLKNEGRADQAKGAAKNLRNKVKGK